MFEFMLSATAFILIIAFSIQLLGKDLSMKFTVSNSIFSLSELDLGPSAALHEKQLSSKLDNH